MSKETIINALTALEDKEKEALVDALGWKNSDITADNYKEHLADFSAQELTDLIMEDDDLKEVESLQKAIGVEPQKDKAEQEVNAGEFKADLSDFLKNQGAQVQNSDKAEQEKKDLKEGTKLEEQGKITAEDRAKLSPSQQRFAKEREEALQREAELKDKEGAEKKNDGVETGGSLKDRKKKFAELHGKMASSDTEPKKVDEPVIAQEEQKKTAPEVKKDVVKPDLGGLAAQLQAKKEQLAHAETDDKSAPKIGGKQAQIADTDTNSLQGTLAKALANRRQGGLDPEEQAREASDNLEGKLAGTSFDSAEFEHDENGVDITFNSPEQAQEFITALREKNADISNLISVGKDGKSISIDIDDMEDVIGAATQLKQPVKETTVDAPQTHKEASVETANLDTTEQAHTQDEPAWQAVGTLEAGNLQRGEASEATNVWAIGEGDSKTYAVEQHAIDAEGLGVMGIDANAVGQGDGFYYLDAEQTKQFEQAVSQPDRSKQLDELNRELDEIEREQGLKPLNEQEKKALDKEQEAELSTDPEYQEISSLLDEVDKTAGQRTPGRRPVLPSPHKENSELLLESIVDGMGTHITAGSHKIKVVQSVTTVDVGPSNETANIKVRLDPKNPGHVNNEITATYTKALKEAIGLNASDTLESTREGDQLVFELGKTDSGKLFENAKNHAAETAKQQDRFSAELPEEVVKANLVLQSSGENIVERLNDPKSREIALDALALNLSHQSEATGQDKKDLESELKSHMQATFPAAGEITRDFLQENLMSTLQETMAAAAANKTAQNTWKQGDVKVDNSKVGKPVLGSTRVDTPSLKQQKTADIQTILQEEGNVSFAFDNTARQTFVTALFMADLNMDLTDGDLFSEVSENAISLTEKGTKLAKERAGQALAQGKETEGLDVTSLSGLSATKGPSLGNASGNSLDMENPVDQQNLEAIRFAMAAASADENAKEGDFLQPEDGNITIPPAQIDAVVNAMAGVIYDNSVQDRYSSQDREQYINEQLAPGIKNGLITNAKESGEIVMKAGDLEPYLAQTYEFYETHYAEQQATREQAQGTNINLGKNEVKDIDYTGKDTNEQLALCCQHGDVTKLQELITAGIDDINKEVSLGNNPLHLAAAYGQTDVVNILLDNGADIHARNDVNDTPLHVAAVEGQPQTVSTLVERGADVNLRGGRLIKNMPLHIAAGKGNTEIAEILLDNGADIHARDNHGLTPLHNAASWVSAGGRTDMVKFLIDRGADVNKKGKDGETPYDQAVNEEIKNSLIDAGATVEVQHEEVQETLRTDQQKIDSIKDSLSSTLGGHSNDRINIMAEENTVTLIVSGQDKDAILTALNNKGVNADEPFAYNNQDEWKITVNESLDNVVEKMAQQQKKGINLEKDNGPVIQPEVQHEEVQETLQTDQQKIYAVKTSLTSAIEGLSEDDIVIEIDGNDINITVPKEHQEAVANVLEEKGVKTIEPAFTSQGMEFSARNTSLDEVVEKIAPQQVQREAGLEVQHEEGKEALVNKATEDLASSRSQFEALLPQSNGDGMIELHSGPMTIGSSLESLSNHIATDMVDSGIGNGNISIQAMADRVNQTLTGHSGYDSENSTLTISRNELLELRDSMPERIMDEIEQGVLKAPDRPMPSLHVSEQYVPPVQEREDNPDLVGAPPPPIQRPNLGVGGHGQQQGVGIMDQDPDSLLDTDSLFDSFEDGVQQQGGGRNQPQQQPFYSDQVIENKFLQIGVDNNSLGDGRVQLNDQQIEHLANAIAFDLQKNNLGGAANYPTDQIQDLVFDMLTDTHGYDPDNGVLKVGRDSLKGQINYIPDIIAEHGVQAGLEHFGIGEYGQQREQGTEGPNPHYGQVGTGGNHGWHAGKPDAVKALKGVDPDAKIMARGTGDNKEYAMTNNDAVLGLLEKAGIDTEEVGVDKDGYLRLNAEQTKDFDKFATKQQSILQDLDAKEAELRAKKEARDQAAGKDHSVHAPKFLKEPHPKLGAGGGAMAGLLIGAAAGGPVGAIIGFFVGALVGAVAATVAPLVVSAAEWGVNQVVNGVSKSYNQSKAKGLEKELDTLSQAREQVRGGNLENAVASSVVNEMDAHRNVETKHSRVEELREGIKDIEKGKDVLKDKLRREEKSLRRQDKAKAYKLEADGKVADELGEGSKYQDRIDNAREKRAEKVEALEKYYTIETDENGKITGKELKSREQLAEEGTTLNTKELKKLNKDYRDADSKVDDAVSKRDKKEEEIRKKQTDKEQKVKETNAKAGVDQVTLESHEQTQQLKDNLPEMKQQLKAEKKVAKIEEEEAKKNEKDQQKETKHDLKDGAKGQQAVDNVKMDPKQKALLQRLAKQAGMESMRDVDTQQNVQADSGRNEDHNRGGSGVGVQ